MSEKTEKQVVTRGELKTSLVPMIFALALAITVSSLSEGCQNHKLRQRIEALERRAK